MELKIGMRVLEQHESVVIKGAMQHAASAAAFYRVNFNYTLEYYKVNQINLFCTLKQGNVLWS